MRVRRNSRSVPTRTAQMITDTARDNKLLPNDITSYVLSGGTATKNEDLTAFFNNERFESS